MYLPISLVLWTTIFVLILEPQNAYVLVNYWNQKVANQTLIDHIAIVPNIFIFTIHSLVFVSMNAVLVFLG